MEFHVDILHHTPMRIAFLILRGSEAVSRLSPSISTLKAKRDLRIVNREKPMQRYASYRRECFHAGQFWLFKAIQGSSFVLSVNFWPESFEETIQTASYTATSFHKNSGCSTSTISNKFNHQIISTWESPPSPSCSCLLSTSTSTPPQKNLTHHLWGVL